mmetsp:Transcript_20937/g.31809  ORF Transcript_20937/g.31809 Transcript_20937/m.31809 type:complete len:145 (-) Transcript_20937:1848-2282(-)
MLLVQIICIFLLCLPEYWLIHTSAMSSLQPNTEIKSCFDTWSNCWNSGDIEGYLDGYLDSPSVRYVSGKKVVRGKDSIAEHFRARGAGGQLSLTHFETDCLTDEHAICFGQYRLELEGGIHEGCFTCHVQKIDKSWKIISDHSS